MAISADRAIFIVGPSGIGKSSIVARFRDGAGSRFKFLSLDTIAAEEGVERGLIEGGSAYDLMKKVGTNSLFMAGISGLFRRIALGGYPDVFLIDVGAAFQNISALSGLSVLHPVICITAEEEEAYRRFTEYRSTKRDFERYKSIEFSSVRKQVYESATYQIDTSGQTLEDAAASFGTLVRTIAGRAEEGAADNKHPLTTDAEASEKSSVKAA